MTPAANTGDASRDRRFPIEGSTDVFATSSTEVSISLHSELGYVSNPPKYIAFGCLSPAPVGGAMIFGDSRKIVQSLPEELRIKFTQKGGYCAGIYSASHWKTCLNTEDKITAETTMISLGWNWDWKEDGSLSWWSSLPAIATHPITGESVFLSSTSFLQAFRNLKDQPKRFGDRSEMTDREFRLLRQAHGNQEIEVMLQPGDIVVLDNWLIKHGRRAYEGPRKHFVFLSNSFVV
jgi:alpha-ketoglutarate-dependent taurine dioxygenase